ncbi:MAG: hypothetical protein HYZ26_05195 [Chloroflexi bacterium]|nr:hypothetical protein [Chloroflexota bacterium]
MTAYKAFSRLALPLVLAALACNFPLTPLPRPGHSGLIEARLAIKPRPHLPLAERPGLKPIGPALEDLPRLSPLAELDLEFGPPGPSPRDEDRPALSGRPQSLDSEHFRIHYTTSGADAVSGKDGDQNGHPDYVEHVARALEYVWQAEIEIFGWPAPPPDGTLGGDERVDVYLVNILTDEEIAGYADGGYRDTFVGDNPNTPVVESRSHHAFMALDNDYREIGGSPAYALDFMRSTAAHEFMHVIQYGIDGGEPADWLWEATATWIQDEVYNDVNDANEVLTAPFKAPDSCQLEYGGEARVEDLDNWYGEWLFLRYISEHYGHATVRAIWEAAASLDGYAAIQHALGLAGTTLEELFSEYTLAVLTRDFEEGEDYPVVRLEGKASLDAVFNPLDGVGQMGADYIELPVEGTLTITLLGGLPGQVVGIRGDEVHVFQLEAGRVAVEGSAFEKLYLIVLNPQTAGRERECAFSGYSVEVQRGGQPSTADSVRGRGHFRPPRVEGLLDPDG